jgi:hypothetical protein
MSVQYFGPDSMLVKGFVEKCKVDKNELLLETKNYKGYVPRDYRGILYRGNELNRSKWFMAARKFKIRKGVRTHRKGPFLNWLPFYAYPGSTYDNAIRNTRALSEKTPNILKMFEKCKKLKLPHATEFNHLIGTAYLKATDGIGKHSDKVKSMVEGSYVVCVTLCEPGGMRPFILEENATGKQTVFMPDNGDAFILGPETNNLYKHFVPTVECEGDPPGRWSICIRAISQGLTPAQQEKRLRESEKSRKKRDAANELKRNQKMQRV